MNNRAAVYPTSGDDMKDQTKTALDALFRQHEDTKRKATEVKEIKAKKEDAALEKFLSVRESIIRRAMEEMGAYVKAKGYAYDVKTEEDSKDNKGRHTPASIRFNLYLDEQRYSSNGFPSLAVICKKEDGRVWFHECTMGPGRGGHAGGVGEAAIGDLTKDLVQEKILKALSQVLG
jgi:hypothetical protein